MKQSFGVILATHFFHEGLVPFRIGRERIPKGGCVVHIDLRYSLASVLRIQPNPLRSSNTEEVVTKSMARRTLAQEHFHLALWSSSEVIRGKLIGLNIRKSIN